jgi:hypothetical protein
VGRLQKDMEKSGHVLTGRLTERRRVLFRLHLSGRAPEKNLLGLRASGNKDTCPAALQRVALSLGFKCKTMIELIASARARKRRSDYE